MIDKLGKVLSWIHSGDLATAPPKASERHGGRPIRDSRTVDYQRSDYEFGLTETGTFTRYTRTRTDVERQAEAVHVHLDSEGTINLRFGSEDGGPWYRAGLTVAQARHVANLLSAAADGAAGAGLAGG